MAEASHHGNSLWICALSVCLTLSFSVFWHCLSLKISFMPFSLSVFQDCSPSVSCTSSVCVTFSSFSPLCFLYSMSSPPIWPGSPFYRKNKGVLLQGRVMCLTVFMNHFVLNVSLVPLTSALYLFYSHQFYYKKGSGLFACSLDEPFHQQKAHIHVPG